MEQVAISLRGRELSWLDFGGPGPVLLALHGSFGRACIFAPIAEHLRGRIRLVGLDQRGHGLSQHGGPFTRDEFVADAAAVLRQRYGGHPVAVLGHSLGESPPTSWPPATPSWSGCCWWRTSGR